MIGIRLVGETKSHRRFVFAFTAAAFILILAAGCGQENPKSGAIYVASSPDSALILLDGANTGRITPDILVDVSAGTHVVSVDKEGFLVFPDSFTVLILPGLADSLTFSLTPEGGVGAIYVSSVPDSAFIFLDGIGTATLTPDTLFDVTTGSHLITVERSGYEVSPASILVQVAEGEVASAHFELTAESGRPVLLESFTNVSCGPCAEVNPMLYSLVDGLGPSGAVLMEFHTSFPSPIDPFYLEQRAVIDYRTSLYQVSQAPWLLVEGTQGLQPNTAEAVISAIEAAAPREEVDLTMRAELLESVLSCSLGVSSAVSQGNYVVSVFITHDEIEFDDPPGTNGETLFRHVVRGELPSPGGIEVEIEGAGPVWFCWTESLDWLESGSGIAVVGVARKTDSPEIVGLDVQELSATP